MKNESIRELKNRIKIFDKLEYSLPLDEIDFHLKRIVNGYMCLTRNVNSVYSYRARIFNKNEDFSKVSTMWYPCPDKIKKQGRLNKVNQSIFYISASHQTATLEIKPKVDDIIVILRIRLKDELRLPHVMELGCAETASQYNLETGINILENSRYRGCFKTKKDLKNNLLIRSMLAKELMKVVPSNQEVLYSKSIVISYFLMSSNEIHGIQFPSIAGDGSRSGGGMNLAIKPKYADELFEADCAWMSKVEDVHGSHGYKMKCIKNAQVINNNSIAW